MFELSPYGGFGQICPNICPYEQLSPLKKLYMHKIVQLCPYSTKASMCIIPCLNDAHIEVLDKHAHIFGYTWAQLWNYVPPAPQFPWYHAALQYACIAFFLFFTYHFMVHHWHCFVLSLLWAGLSASSPIEQRNSTFVHQFLHKKAMHSLCVYIGELVWIGDTQMKNVQRWGWIGVIVCPLLCTVFILLCKRVMRFKVKGHLALCLAQTLRWFFFKASFTLWDWDACMLLVCYVRMTIEIIRIRLKWDRFPDVSFPVLDPQNVILLCFTNEYGIKRCNIIIVKKRGSPAFSNTQ